MRLAAIGLAMSALTAACAEGVFEPYDPDSGGGSNGGSSSSGGASSGGRGGGSSGRGGSGATGGTGGRAGTGGTGGTGGSAGRSGSGGSSGASGRGGTGGGASDGGATGCPGVTDWAMGGTYAQGDRVRAVCNVSGSAPDQCTVGKTYTWTCNDPGLGLCGFVGPGTANWWLTWSVGTLCN